MNEWELTGRARSHIIELEYPRTGLHREAVTSYLAMRASADLAGIDLVPVSGFRDFDRQVVIWNRKWRGERPLYDRQGARIDRGQLDDEQAVETILCWSAVPGGSRHHWGSDMDVIDAAAMPEDYQLQLVAAEYEAGGVFERLTDWLNQNMMRFGFHRPYASDRAGTGVEPWHLSYYPVASRAMEALTLPVLQRAIAGSEMLGKAAVLAQLPEIYRRFISEVDPPPETSSAAVSA